MVNKYGIRTADELANAKALIAGRMAIGTGLIMMANVHYMNGNLRGNGPTDRRQRQLWIDSGVQDLSILEELGLVMTLLNHLTQYFPLLEILAIMRK